VLRALRILARVFPPLAWLIIGTCPHAEATKKAHGLAFESRQHTPKFDYEAFYSNELEKKHKDKSYRFFNNINRVFTPRYYVDCSSQTNSRMLIPRIVMSASVFGVLTTISACPVIQLSSKPFTALSTAMAPAPAELATFLPLCCAYIRLPDIINMPNALKHLSQTSIKKTRRWFSRHAMSRTMQLSQHWVVNFPIASSSQTNRTMLP
jgi:hypothetical protein